MSKEFKESLEVTKMEILAGEKEIVWDLSSFTEHEQLTAKILLKKRGYRQTGENKWNK